jgi:hypothetical protein
VRRLAQSLRLKPLLLTNYYFSPLLTSLGLKLLRSPPSVPFLNSNTVTVSPLTLDILIYHPLIADIDLSSTGEFVPVTAVCCHTLQTRKHPCCFQQTSPLSLHKFAVTGSISKSSSPQESISLLETSPWRLPHNLLVRAPPCSNQSTTVGQGTNADLFFRSHAEGHRHR